MKMIMGRVVGRKNVEARAADPADQSGAARALGLAERIGPRAFFVEVEGLLFVAESTLAASGEEER